MNSTRMRWRVISAARDQAQAGERRTDRTAGQHIARIVQPEHHARGGDQARERDQYPGELGEIRHRLPGERHRVQRVARRKAVAIQRRHRQRDAGMADERPLAHQCVLEPAVDEQPDDAGDGHADRRPQRRPP